jgi:hypothetical protein
MTNRGFNKKKVLFTSTLGLNLRKKLVKCYTSSIFCMELKTGPYRTQIRNTWKVLKCGAKEVGLIK